MVEGELLEFVDEDDAALDQSEVASFSQAVLYASDWTVETILLQLKKANIELNPRFQRRDAWSVKGKSRFIESIILGLPIPQIVLAEKKGARGQFIVLDGKQRLLSLLQFTGQAQGPRNSFGLSGLEARTDLSRKRYRSLQGNDEFRQDLDAFLNHTIRTVVIRNWPNTDFLHLVFLRLNTGSVKLSPQELRQAMVPGPFSDFADDEAVTSKELRRLLGRKEPDPRMRDVELLVRFLAFRRFLSGYAGRMKPFLDETCRQLNETWRAVEKEVEEDVRQFYAGIETLIDILGVDTIARKLDSVSFNRAIFDALIFYAADPKVRRGMEGHKRAVKTAYGNVLKNLNFAEAIESDTAGIPHTHDRLAIWGRALAKAIGVKVAVPRLVKEANSSRIQI